MVEMFSLLLVPIFIGLTAAYFLVKSYYLRTVYVVGSLLVECFKV